MSLKIQIIVILIVLGAVKSRLYLHWLSNYNVGTEEIDANESCNIDRDKRLMKPFQFDKTSL